MHNRLKSKIFISFLLTVLFSFCVVVSCPAQAGDSQHTQSNKSSADGSLKARGRVNPSTLAMEFSLPLGGYAGRGGNTIPITLNYSSKLWQIEARGNWRSEQSIIMTDSHPKFAEKSSAGWTSSLVPPRIEIKEEFYDESGDPWQFFDALQLYQVANQQENNLNQRLPDGCYEVDRSTECWQDDYRTVCKTTIFAYCHHGTGYTTFDRVDSMGGGGWGGNENYSYIKYVKRVRVIMPDGSAREFRQDDTVHPYCTTAPNSSFCNGTPNTYEITGTYFSVDGSKMKLVIGDSEQNADSILYLPDGGRYLFGTAGKMGDIFYATKYIDVNGNTTLYSQNGVIDPVIEEAKLQGKITDTLGRQIVDPLAQNKEVKFKEGKQLYQTSGVGGQPQNYILNWSKLENVRQDPAIQPLSYLGVNVCFIGGQNTSATHNDGKDDPNVPDDDDGPVLFSGGYRTRVCSARAGTNERKFNPVVLAGIQLPDGSRYEFKYNQYGEINKIVYPSGGYEQFFYSNIIPLGNKPSHVYDQANRGVTNHKIYAENDTLLQEWSYTASINDGVYPVPLNAPYVVTITAPDGTQTVRYLHRTEDADFGFSDPRSGMPYEEYLYKDSTRQVLLSRKHSEWASMSQSGGDPRARRDPHLTGEDNYIFEGAGSALKKSVTYGYDNDLNVTKVSEYPFVVVPNEMAATTPAEPPFPCTDDCPTPTPTPYPTPNPEPPVRVTETTYLVNDSTIPEDARNAYRWRQMLGLPTLKVIKDGQENEIAKTQISYDDQTNYPLLTYGGDFIGWLNPKDDPSIPAENRPSDQLPLRGNATTSKAWDNIGNAWIVSHAQFDQFGNVRKAWSPEYENSNNPARITETFYEDKFSDNQNRNLYAFPTRTKSPKPDPSGQHGSSTEFETTAIYDFTTGVAPKTKDANNLETVTEKYDSFSRPIEVKQYSNGVKVGGATEFVYPVPVEGKFPQEQRFSKVRTQIDADKWAEATTWADSLGRPIAAQAKETAGDVCTVTLYDQMGRVWKVSNPFRRTGTTDCWQYQTTPSLQTGLKWTTTEYDSLGRIIIVTPPLEDNQPAPKPSVTEYSLATESIKGTVVTATDPAGKQSRSIMDALGRLIRVDEPKDTTSGGMTTTTLGTIDDPSQPTRYSYDALGNLVKVEQGEQSRFFLYDSLGRLLRVRQPEQDENSDLTLNNPVNFAITRNAHWTAAFSYDANGNVKTATDAKGVVITNTYDNLNRVNTRTYSGINPNHTDSKRATALTSSVSFKYDGLLTPIANDQQPPIDPISFAKGKLTEVKNDESISQMIDFDSMGRLEASRQITRVGTEPVTSGRIDKSSYKYTLSGALEEQTYPSGRVVKNAFNADGDLSKITSLKNGVSKTFASDFTYTAAGAISDLKLGNGLYEAARFNQRQQITRLVLSPNPVDAAPNPSGAEQMFLIYDYGTAENNGNIRQQTSVVPAQGGANGFYSWQQFTYDSLNRLTNATEQINEFGGSAWSQTWQQTFDYDRYGNRKAFSQNIDGTNLNTNSNPVNFPTINEANNRFNDNQGYKYDYNGNIIQDTSKLGNRRFVFNADNKQTEVKSLDYYGNETGVTAGQYFYDGGGKRVKKIVGNETTIFVYDALGKLIAEYSTAAPLANPQTSYTATDLLGSPRVITDQNGQVTARRDFMPFGEELYANTAHRKTQQKFSATGEDKVRQRFTGYEKDKETELDFAEARYYQNKHGRFTAVDPLLASGKSANPQTFNRYVYVLNNPLILTDPDGLQAGSPAGTINPTGTWYRQKGGGRPVYRDNNLPVTHDLEEITETNRWSYGTPVYRAEGQDEFHVIRLHPNGPQPDLPTTDVRNGARGVYQVSDFQRNGWEEIWSNRVIEPNPGVRDVSLETFGAAQGVGSLLRAGGRLGINRLFATEKDKAVFFTGGGSFEPAANSGGTTIGMTPGGKIIDGITSAKVFGRRFDQVFPGTSTRLWDFGSAPFARGAAGDVRAIIGFNPSLEKTFFRVEYPILRANPNVNLSFRILQGPPPPPK